MKNLFKSILWTFPFICFLGGYYTLSLFYSPKGVIVPVLMGQSVKDALKVTSDMNLNLKIIGEKIDGDLPEGTIVYQMPLKQTVKPNQTIYILISKLQERAKMPELRGKTLKDIERILQEKDLKIKKYFLTGCPAVCICQNPALNEVVPDERIILYLGSNQQKPVLFPDLRGLSLSEVDQFLSLHALNSKVYYKGKEEPNPREDRIVFRQKPAPGSILNLNRLSMVLLEIN